MRFLIGPALLALAFVIPFGGAAPAHEGHDHGDQPALATPIAPRGSSTTDSLELVAVARDGVVAIHLDRFDTNEPVSGAAIEVETPEGTVQAKPTGPGSYAIAAPWSRRTGEYELTVTVAAEGSTDVFPVTLDIHGEEPAPPKTSWLAPPALAGGIGARLGEEGVFAVAVASFLLGIGTALLVRRRSRRAAALLVLLALALPAGRARAHDEAAHDHRTSGPAAPAAPGPGPHDRAQRMQDGDLFVPKPTQRLLAIRTLVTEAKEHPAAIELPGRVIADPNGSGLVQSAQGGRLGPPPEGFARIGTRVRKGQVLAYATPPVQLVDTSDMLQRQGELDQQISILEKRVARYEVLVRNAIVSRVQLDDAKAELRGLHERRAGLDKVRGAPEALAAPIDGVVAEANAMAGQIAQPSAVIFQIVDPARLLVEALSFEAPAAMGEARAHDAAGHVVRLRFLGAGLADRNQAVPVHFAIEGAAGGLRIGRFVTVTAARDEGRRGIALPRAAIVRGGNGQSLVFEKTGPERFAPREVRVEPLDGERVIVAAGIGTGRRVVTDGAELLNQVR